jgi:hypothetical protein
VLFHGSSCGQRRKLHVNHSLGLAVGLVFVKNHGLHGVLKPTVHGPPTHNLLICPPIEVQDVQTVGFE